MAKTDRIIAEELKRVKKAGELKEHAKSHPTKLAVATRLRKKTTLTIREIAERLHMGSWKSLNDKLYLAGKASKTPKHEKAKSEKLWVTRLFKLQIRCRARPGLTLPLIGRFGPKSFPT